MMKRIPLVAGRQGEKTERGESTGWPGASGRLHTPLNPVAHFAVFVKGEKNIITRAGVVA